MFPASGSKCPFISTHFFSFHVPFAFFRLHFICFSFPLFNFIWISATFTSFSFNCNCWVPFVSSFMLFLLPLRKWRKHTHIYIQPIFYLWDLLKTSPGLYGSALLGRRKFRSQISDNMDRWKAEMGTVREEKRRKKIKNEKVSEERRSRRAKR